MLLMLATPAPDPPLPLVIWRSVKKRIREAEAVLPSARLISLDHDLEPQDGDEEDRWDGSEVARFLAERVPSTGLCYDVLARRRSEPALSDECAGHDG